MVVNGMILCIFLLFGILFSGLGLLVSSVWGTKKSIKISGVLLIVFFLLFVSGLISVATRNNIVVDTKPVEERIYTIDTITQDYIKYGYDFLDTYTLNFTASRKKDITLYKVDNLEEQKLKVIKYKFRVNWFTDWLYIKDTCKKYEIYVTDKTYEFLKCMLDTDYVLYKGENKQ